MKPFISFIKMQLNVNYGISALKYRFTREKKKLWEPVLIAAAILVSLLPLLAMYTGWMISIFNGGLQIGQPEMVLAISFVFAQLVILIFGIFYIMGAFYFSKDLEMLVPLPLRPYEVIAGKFAVVMVNEYLTSLPILLPPVIIFGTGTSQGILYWLKSLILMAVIPAMPLAIASVLVIVLMRIVNIGRYKDLLAIVGGIVLVFGSMFGSMLFQKIPENPEDIQEFFAGQGGLTDMIGSRFPPAIWATKGLYKTGPSGFGYFLLYIAVSVALILLMFWISDRIFYKALLSGQEVRRKRKTLTGSKMEKKFSNVTSPVMALFRREWKLMIRTPLYVLNGLVGSITGPIILLFMIMAQDNDQELAEMLAQLSKPEILPYAVLICAGVMLFTGGMNIVSSTAVSREGRTIWIAKMIPVPAKQQVTAKFLCSYSVSAIGVLTTGLIVLIFLKLPVLWVTAVTIVGLAGSVPMTAFSLLIDVFHPKLVWNSEQEAMKQNMNGVLGMLLSFVILVILGAVAVGTLLIGIPLPGVLAAVFAASVFIGTASIFALFAVAEKKYREIEA